MVAMFVTIHIVFVRMMFVRMVFIGVMFLRVVLLRMVFSFFGNWRRGRRGMTSFVAL